MKIVVCIKPVKTGLVFAENESNDPFVMNPYDLYALQQCLSLKQDTNCEIICISMGPESAKPILFRALAMGADQAILINGKEFAGSDTLATSYILYQAIRKISGVDLIVCGERTIDGETGQVVYGIAERLSYYCLDNLETISSCNDKQIFATQKDENTLIKLKLNLPAVLSFSNFTVGHPRVSLLELKRAKKREINIWGYKEIDADLSLCGQSGSRTQVVNVKNDLIKKDTELIKGSVSEKAEAIISMTLGGGYN